MRRICYAPLVALIAVSLIAGGDVRAQGRGYHVEIIVFSNVNPDTGGELFFPPTEVAGNWQDALALWSAASQDDASAAYMALTDGELRMRSHVRRLQDSSEYQPVAHVAWRQPAISDPELVRLTVTPEACGRKNAIDGVMRVRNLGELVFEFDLRYIDCSAAESPDEVPVFRIHGIPQVLFNRVYYFDHPLLGVLMEVRREETSG